MGLNICCHGVWVKNLQRGNWMVIGQIGIVVCHFDNNFGGSLLAMVIKQHSGFSLPFYSWS